MPKDGGRPIQKRRRVRSFGTRNFLQFCRGSSRAFPHRIRSPRPAPRALFVYAASGRKLCLIRIAPHVTNFLKELIAPAVQSFSFAKNLFANHRAHFDYCAWRSIWAVASIGETPCHAQPKIDANARTMATADASADRRLSQRHIRMSVGTCACRSRARRTSRFEQSTRPDRSVDEIEGNEAFRNPEGLKMPPISLRWPWCRSFQRVWPRAASRRRTTAHVPPATCPWPGTAGCRAASAWWSRPDPKRPCAAPH